MAPAPPKPGAVRHAERARDHVTLALRASVTMAAAVSKPEIVRAVSELPEDATVEDAMERLLWLSRIADGLDQSRRGETVPHAEVVRQIEEQMARWRAAG